MPSSRPAVSESTRRAIQRAGGDLGAAAVQQVEASHAWYRGMSAEHRSWVALVAQAGIRDFLDWFAGEQRPEQLASTVFGAAPRELARAISLAQTLQLVRTMVDVVERETAGLAAPGDEQALRESILRYSREVAFSAAEVYAQAAETRGAWDARLESLVVDAVIRGEADDSMQSRAAALGWGSTTRVCVIVGSTPTGSPAGVVEELHRTARHHQQEVLVAVQGRRVVCIAGDVVDDLAVAKDLSTGFGDGPVVVGPIVPHLFAAGRSARAALSGHAGAAAWPGAPRPVRADDLLGERALLGDQPARGALVSRIHDPLRDSPGGHLLETAAAWLDNGQGIEGTARALFVHPNTVRYRLASIARTVGYDLADAHDAQTVRLALAFARLASPGWRVPGR